MSFLMPKSDDDVINLLRITKMSVSELSVALGVTATSVRQRLMRLMIKGIVVREAATNKRRGRPMHHYSLKSAPIPN